MTLYWATALFLIRIAHCLNLTTVPSTGTFVGNYYLYKTNKVIETCKQEDEINIAVPAEETLTMLTRNLETIKGTSQLWTSKLSMKLKSFKDNEYYQKYNRLIKVVSKKTYRDTLNECSSSEGKMYEITSDNSYAALLALRTTLNLTSGVIWQPLIYHKQNWGFRSLKNLPHSLQEQGVKLLNINDSDLCGVFFIDNHTFTQGSCFTKLDGFCYANIQPIDIINAQMTNEKIDDLTSQLLTTTLDLHDWMKSLPKPTNLISDPLTGNLFSKKTMGIIENFRSLDSGFLGALGSNLANYLESLQNSLTRYNDHSAHNIANNLIICCNQNRANLITNPGKYTTHSETFTNSTHLLLTYKHLSNCQELPVKSYIKLTDLETKHTQGEVVTMQNKTWCFNDECTRQPCSVLSLTEFDLLQSNKSYPQCTQQTEDSNFTFTNSTHHFLALTTPTELTGECLTGSMPIQVILSTKSHGSCTWNLESDYSFTGAIKFFNTTTELVMNSRKNDLLIPVTTATEQLYNYVIIASSIATILALAISAYMCTRVSCYTGTQACQPTAVAESVQLRPILRFGDNTERRQDYRESSSSDNGE